LNNNRIVKSFSRKRAVMSDHKVLRAILIVLTLIGVGVASRALWGEKLKELSS
jgi:hypothetical protein